MKERGRVRRGRGGRGRPRLLAWPFGVVRPEFDARENKDDDDDDAVEKGRAIPSASSSAFTLGFETHPQPAHLPPQYPTDIPDPLLPQLPQQLLLSFELQPRGRTCRSGELEEDSRVVTMGRDGATEDRIVVVG